jgi:hypothetical protein
LADAILGGKTLVQNSWYFVFVVHCFNIKISLLYQTKWTFNNQMIFPNNLRPYSLVVNVYTCYEKKG